MSVGIIDYGMCNLGSVRRAFEECGADVAVIDNSKHLSQVDQIVLPGVGAFSKGMKNLHQGGWVDALAIEVKEKKKPLLGICLGMQLLSDFGIEGGETKGLGFISGSVKKLEAESASFRIPHVGWNEIHFSNKHPMLARIEDGTDFYFVHSFYFSVKDVLDEVAQTSYGMNFTSIVAHENVWGVQFHPEKSQKPGFQLIKNFLAEK